MSKKDRKEVQQSGLSAFIERSVEREPISMEKRQEEVSTEEILEFTGAFLEDLQRMPRLEKYSLMSPEEARRAVEMLEAKRRFLEQKMKSAASLKQMLQKRGRPGDNYQ